MFSINYRIHWDREKSMDLKNIGDMDFRYDFFLGDITLTNDDSNIRMDWGWIPILDFAISMELICQKISKNNSAREIFEFTDSGGELLFTKEELRISVMPSFSEELLELNVVEFKSGVQFFCKEVIEEITVKKPDALNNPIFNNYLKNYFR